MGNRNCVINSSYCYDCLFYSADLKKTFGQATEEEKNDVNNPNILLEWENFTFYCFNTTICFALLSLYW